MPLSKGSSKEAFKRNVSAEIRAGKPRDQALAIAYSVKRRNKKMADGGAVREDDVEDLYTHKGTDHPENIDERFNRPLPDHGHAMEIDPDKGMNDHLNPYNIKRLSQGGKVYNDNEKLHPEAAGRASYPQEHKGETMNDSKMIASRVRARKMSQGGLLGGQKEDDKIESPFDKQDPSDYSYSYGKKMSVGGEVKSLTDGDQDPHDRRPHEYEQSGDIHEEGDVRNQHDEDMRQAAHEDGLRSFSEGGYIMGDDADAIDDEPMGNSWESDEFLAHSDGGQMTGNNHSEFDPQDEPTKKRGRLERVLAQIRMEHHGKKS